MKEETQEGNVQVDAYAGATYPEEPRAFMWQGQRVELARVEAQWREPGKSMWLVVDTAGGRFRMSYEVERGEWQVSKLGQRWDSQSS
ncbi:MAG: hypothetical protein Q8P22_07995 [Chloroflexota bacterium]|nr:hypothetical protein [Chloroflexota bacterium]